MRKFLVLVKKELKELITIQMLAPLLISALLLVFVGNVIGAEVEKAEGRQSILVSDLDDSRLSNVVIAALGEARFDVVEGDWTPEEASDVLSEADEQVMLMIPDGFADSVTGDEPVPLRTYTSLRSFSLVAAEQASVARAVVNSVSKVVSDQLIAEAAPGEDVERLKNPFALEEYVQVGHNLAQMQVEGVMGFVSQQTTFIPIVLFMVIIFAAQMIATTIAAEKENKTLETLLASPISRSALVTAKMVSAGLVALIAAIAYMGALRYYMDGLIGGPADTTGLSESAEGLGLVLGAGDYALLGVTLFLGILCALAIALILGSFVDSVRAVGVVITPLMALIMIPYFLVLMLDVATLSPALKYLVFAIPFSYPMMVAPNLFLDNYTLVWWGIAYQAFLFAVFAFIAARIFSSDKILTLKLRIGRRKSVV